MTNHVIARLIANMRRSPGIDDNGSGMVATLEVARILSQRPQLNHTVMFVAFDLEELVSGIHATAT